MIPEWMKKEVAEYALVMTPAPVTVLDIGACVGAFALVVHAQWPEAQIRCYEPVAENFGQLTSNVHNIRKIQSYRFAVRAFNGHDKILTGDNGATCGFYQLGRQTGVMEKVMCIDAAEIPSAELVKIDTEGCEVEIVSRLNLAKTRGLVVEYHRQADIEPIMAAALKSGLLFLGQEAKETNWGFLKFGRAGTALPKEEGRVKNEEPPKKTLTEGNEANQTAAQERSPTAIKLSVRHIYCGVASHFSNHDITFLQSMMALILGAQVRISFGWNCDPSVERARNVLTANFLASDCTHLFFIDADIGFTPRDFMRIVSHDEDIVAGTYPIKNMDREVKWCGNQLQTQSDEGKTGETPVPLPGTVRRVSQCEKPSRCETPVPLPGTVRPDGLQEVGCMGTGFMCIARRAFEKILETDREKIRYTQDWPPHREEFAFWRQTVRVVNGQRRFLTEDWNFCYRYRELGGKVFADTTVILRHAGRAVWPLELQSGNPFMRSPKIEQPSNQDAKGNEAAPKTGGTPVPLNKP